MKKCVQAIWILLAVSWAAPALAQDLIVFPAKGQSQEQMEKDKYECDQWAKKETGFDPSQAQPSAETAPSPSQARSGERVRGAARGAAVGAVVGEIANDDAGKGALAGAAGGTMVGGMRSRERKRQEAQPQQQQAQQQQSAYSQKQGTYNRAYSACLEAKGYTVK
ncbi:MAG: hypothetical protein CVU57_22925 [Deltaproteobacteria bacterium HGW-Deltaproteobacteria-15]|jgi:hypothetical protein|nr:MAG: hypothetical protein CVU57_22925 [Deltaproteobacteria bacterium HGW-Deltaproteobacteria-15]